MTCKEFDSLVSELARAGLLQAEEREQAFLHTERCAQCAARLANEKSLTAAFQAVAQIDKSRQASGRVEANLRAAFRLQKSTSDCAIDAPSQNRPLPLPSR